MTIRLTEDQLELLIRWYGRTTYRVSTIKNWLQCPYLDERYFHDNGLIECAYDMIGSTTLTKGYILTTKAKEIVKRREPLRLVIELMSRVNKSLPSRDLADIVRRIPFRELPQLLACDDTYIQELAVRRLRKREFFSGMRRRNAKKAI